MARRTRTATVGDYDSLEENVGATTLGKEVKVKQENTKKGKARRVESDDEEEDAQAPSQLNGMEGNDVCRDAEGEELEGNGNEDEGEEGTPKGHKRARVNSVGASVALNPNRVERERVQTLPRGDDG